MTLRFGEGATTPLTNPRVFPNASFLVFDGAVSQQLSVQILTDTESSDRLQL